MSQIVCIGASTLYGIGGSRGGWPDLLKLHLHEQQFADGRFEPKHQVFNYGISGATIAQIAERLTIELTSTRKSGRHTLAILHLGANDALASPGPTDYITTLPDYQQRVSALIRQAKDLSDDLLVLGVTPMDESKTTPYHSDPTGVTAATKPGVYFTNDRIHALERCQQQVCAELNITFLPLFDAATKLGWVQNYLAADGCHPNDAGHDWLFDQVMQQIKPKL